MFKHTILETLNEYISFLIEEKNPEKFFAEFKHRQRTKPLYAGNKFYRQRFIEHVVFERHGIEERGRIIFCFCINACVTENRMQCGSRLLRYMQRIIIVQVFF